MSLKDILKLYENFYAAEGSGYIFLVPIGVSEFDHTMYRFPVDQPDNVEEYDRISFIMDGYDDVDSDVEPVPFNEIVERYSR